jgi:hypothetical protein
MQDVSINEHKANAKLIAASPELLEAAIKMVQFFDKEYLSQCDAYYELKQAIKKATK